MHKAQFAWFLCLSAMLSSSAFTTSNVALWRLGSAGTVRPGSIKQLLSKRGLRGGGTRPWRDIPLEEGEIGFYHNPSSGTSTVMTATDWTKTEDPQLIVSDYPDPQIFASRLEASDPDIARILSSELERQQGQLELIASENIVSKAVLQAQVQSLHLHLRKPTAHKQLNYRCIRRTPHPSAPLPRPQPRPMSLTNTTRDPPHPTRSARANRGRNPGRPARRARC